MADTWVLGLVGPCAAGKSTLAQLLAPDGHRIRQIAQEHSFAPDMWRRIANPDFLVFLDVSFEETLRRRGANWWARKDFDEQQRRLRHARKHADLYLLTDALEPQLIASAVRAALDV